MEKHGEDVSLIYNWNQDCPNWSKEFISKWEIYAYVLYTTVILQLHMLKKEVDYKNGYQEVGCCYNKTWKYMSLTLVLGGGQQENW